MTAGRIGDMTHSELRAFVEAIVEERTQGEPRRCYKQRSRRPIEEVLASIRRNVVTPKPGTPSIVEMLREDRDR